MNTTLQAAKALATAKNLAYVSIPNHDDGKPGIFLAARDKSEYEFESIVMNGRDFVAAIIQAKRRIEDAKTMFHLLEKHETREGRARQHANRASRAASLEAALRMAYEWSCDLYGEVELRGGLRATVSAIKEVENLVLLALHATEGMSFAPESDDNLDPEMDRRFVEKKREELKAAILEIES